MSPSTIERHGARARRVAAALLCSSLALGMAGAALPAQAYGAGASGRKAAAPRQIAKPAITATHVGTKTVGETSYVWGKISGFSGPATVMTQVIVKGKWSTSQKQTGVTGSYSIPLTYGINTAGQTRWRVVAQAGSQQVVSQEFTLTRTAARKPAVTATSNGTAEVGVRSEVRGTVSGFGAPATVSTQVKVRGSWSTSQKQTGVTGSYALPLTYNQSTPGTQTYRVVAQGGGATAISPEFTFTRKAKPKPVTLDKRCLTGRAMCVSKKDRKLRWVINGEVKMTLDARFGGEKTPTRNGAFSVGWKSRNHVSSLYGSPMPFAMFFSGGQAVHYSQDFANVGYNGASHGCVNIRDRKQIEKLFDQVRVGDKVIVYTT